MFDQCLYFNTTALARQLEREWTAAFAPFGLTPPQAFMLRTILDQPGIQHGELAAAMAISRPTATRTLDGLEARGLAERRAAGSDGRAQAIHPTPAAKALHRALNEASGKVTRRLKQVLGEDHFLETVQRLRTVRSALA